jgi:hypothetical protein
MVLIASDYGILGPKADCQLTTQFRTFRRFLRFAKSGRYGFRA